MTQAEAEVVLHGVTFRGLLAAIRLTCAVEGPRVVLRIPVPNVLVPGAELAPLSHPTLWLNLVDRDLTYADASNAWELVSKIREALKRMLAHEVDEGLCVNNVLPFNPHRKLGA